MSFRYIAPVLTHEGFLHLIRECDIFREFSIYIPVENYVTDFSLYIRAVGTRPQRVRKMETPIHNDSRLEFSISGWKQSNSMPANSLQYATWHLHREP